MNRLPTLELVRLPRDLGGNPKLKKRQPYWWKPVNSTYHLETQNPFQISHTVKENYYLEGRGGLSEWVNTGDNWGFHTAFRGSTYTNSLCPWKLGVCT